MSLFDPYQREDFAKAIVEASNLSGSTEGPEFVQNFKQLQNIKMTLYGQDQIVQWIKYSNGALGATRSQIKSNYRSPHTVYDFLLKEVNPRLV